MEEWLVKYDGQCALCGLELKKGSPAVWDRPSRTIRCVKCPPIVRGVISEGVAGASAQAQYDRLHARREAAITERWGTGFVAKVVRTVSVEPQSTRAWAIGAAGEQKLGQILADFPQVASLHDRRVPGTRGNIDHIAIGPAGVFVIDAKAHKGFIAIQDRGGWFTTDERLTVDRRDVSKLADAMTWQVDAVRAALGELDPAPPISAALCFLEAAWPRFFAPKSFRGVHIVNPKTIGPLLVEGDALVQGQIEVIAAALSRRLPPK